MTCPPRSRPWTRGQIQAARRASLPALLSARGLHLREDPAGNYHIREHPGVIVKRSFWREPEADRSGNAIDFFVEVLGMSFHRAMEAITR